jgi:hypothetical protein
MDPEYNIPASLTPVLEVLAPHSRTGSMAEVPALYSRTGLVAEVKRRMLLATVLAHGPWTELLDC